jgi:uncharacterized membrane protein YcaP (DUF421 family)
MLFGGWPTLARTAIIGVLAYVTLVIILRISGKRTLSKFNAYDFIVTVALGSTLASIITTRDVTLAQGAVAFLVLIVLQFIITWVSTHSNPFRRIVQGEPTLVFYRGTFLKSALHRERVTADEIRSAARSQGIATMTDLEAAVLETDGSITVVRNAPSASPSSLSDVKGYLGAKDPGE